MDYQHYNKILAFSLIELMVTIGIIALLTTVATPIYVSYTIKANVSSAIPILEGLKTRANEFYTANGTFPTNLTQINSITYSDSIISSTQVKSGSANCPAVGSTTLGCVQVTFNNPSKPTFVLNGQVLSLVAVDNSTTSADSVAIQWICKSGDNTGSNTINNNYLPKSCQ